MALPVRIKCKKCGRDAKSDEFILDPVFKIMVCKECVKERKIGEVEQKKLAAQEAVRAARHEEQKKSMPAGWDHEDAEIERAYNRKMSDREAFVERIDDDRVKYTCKKCKYSFTYYTSQKRPLRCPYCSTAVQV
jgi:Zn finger protein HypA/HybF involved in hydrogenase expression